MNFRYRLYRFMSGRYGMDETFFVITAVAVVLAFINCFTRNLFVQLAVYALMLLAFLRAFSRNIPARQRENRFFKSVAGKIAEKRELHRRRRADFRHIYKKCPHCGAVLRLPRKKGRHTTTCPRCGKEFRVRVYRDS